MVIFGAFVSQVGQHLPFLSESLPTSWVRLACRARRFILRARPAGGWTLTEQSANRQMFALFQGLAVLHLDWIHNFLASDTVDALPSLAVVATVVGTHIDTSYLVFLCDAMWHTAATSCT